MFQGRFRSENVETITYFYTVPRYIHQNPIKAGLANNIFDCKWTSINEYSGRTNLVDIDFALQLFSSNRSKAIQLFTDYMQKTNDDQCLDDYVKVRISDSEVRSLLFKLGIPNNSTLQQMKKKKRDAIILELRELNGVSVRQIARITGISKSVVDRVR